MAPGRLGNQLRVSSLRALGTSRCDRQTAARVRLRTMDQRDAPQRVAGGGLRTSLPGRPWFRLEIEIPKGKLGRVSYFGVGHSSRMSSAWLEMQRCARSERTLLRFLTRASGVYCWAVTRSAPVHHAACLCRVSENSGAIRRGEDSRDTGLVRLRPPAAHLSAITFRGHRAPCWPPPASLDRRADGPLFECHGLQALDETGNM